MREELRRAGCVEIDEKGERVAWRLMRKGSEVRGD